MLFSNPNEDICRPIDKSEFVVAGGSTVEDVN